MSESTAKTGGQLLVDALKTHGVRQAFCLPGESYLAVLDALYDAPEIELTVCRHEGAAAMMADAHGKLSGRAGVCLVTRAPGATNASAGLHIAFQDSTPLLLLIGQVGRQAAEREAFQEVDYRRAFSQMAKWVAQIDDAARIPELVSRAFHTAVNGRPGPVVLALPEDMLTEAKAAPRAMPYQRVEAHPAEVDVERVSELLAGAARPLAIVGGAGWDRDTCAGFQDFAETFALPVVSAFRCQDYFDNDHANYIGTLGLGVDPRLLRRIEAADLLLVVGARLGQMTTANYTLLKVPRPDQRLIHVHPGMEELGRVYQADLLINASVRAFVAALAGHTPTARPTRGEFLASSRREYLHWTRPRRVGGDLELAEIIDWLRGQLSDEAIVTNGAGHYSAWVHRFFRFRRYRTQLAPTAGSMGYGVPAALAAKRLFPHRPAVAFAGDGDFLINGQEMATAVQYGLDAIVIVVNNAMYGTIRLQQEHRYPGRVIGTEVVNPDFARLAEAYGAHGEVVTKTEQFPRAYERAVSAGGPALIELRVERASSRLPAD